MNSKKIIDLCLISLFCAIICISSQIVIPLFTIPFTLQTFAIFLCLLVLGGKKGTVTIFSYILIGSLGLPVFASFNSGISAILGVSGGFIIGFLFIGLIYILFEILRLNKILALILGLLVCYIFGGVWLYFYIPSMGIEKVLLTAILPFIIPDFIKLALAVFISSNIKKIIAKVI